MFCRRAEPVGCSHPAAADQSTGGLDRRSTPSPWREQWLRRKRRLRRRAAPRRRSRLRSLVVTKKPALCAGFLVFTSLGSDPELLLSLCRLHIDWFAAGLVFYGIDVRGELRCWFFMVPAGDNDSDRLLRLFQLTTLRHPHLLLVYARTPCSRRRGAMQRQCRGVGMSKLLFGQRMRKTWLLLPPALSRKDTPNSGHPYRNETCEKREARGRVPTRLLLAFRFSLLAVPTPRSSAP